MGKLNKNDADLKATSGFDDKKVEAYRQASSILTDAEMLETDPYSILLSKINNKVEELVGESNTNDDKTGISNAQSAAIIVNAAKEGITTSQKSAITANTAKTGITGEQANDIDSTKKTVNSLLIVNATKGTIAFGPPDERNGNMVIQVIVGKKKFNYTLSAE